ncbi:Wadjet anti-phage system protein JetD domain-containing protein [Catellatospora methionotrophica]|uniref:Wadjet anti-phage system protein JetD domain-containing protein n=1 Tax=Catellatospora methionotrophica TaxID=121620 RepID=UPI0033C15265
MPAADSWPYAFALGQPSAADLTGDFAGAAAWAAAWRTWAAANGLTLRQRGRRVMGTEQELPTHLVVPDIDDAARICGRNWAARLARGRARARSLDDRFPRLAGAGLLAATVTAVDEMSDMDFDLLCRAGHWFSAHSAAGLTPRQVPIEGLHSKWLNHRLDLVRRLAGHEDLGLLPPHPPRVHFTYLDPAHLTAGGRRHDSATIGDRVKPAYRPQVVVISENKDTAIHFPSLEGAISVEGMGRGAGSISALPWLTTARHILYWGDMDADGLEILNEFRAAGIPASSILMDIASYEQWERFGTNEDARGRPLRWRPPRHVPYLTEDEATLYRCLTSPDWKRCRRVEQERIPLDVAVAHVRDHLS